MLILNRKIGESIIVGEDIEITILEIEEGRVKIGIDAPRDINILRKEIYIDITEENKKSLEIDGDVLDILKKL
ncbi:carbon storage regulator CsrA [Tissierella creatinophila]|uniref:Translational regulator CsrA n=1 Tax=Tissierella creatinophila DSM 6911 TaxID=1123403 RepID=A0A1U7M2J6_TISCR|nr:carbon storage regulator CsrA [Tissierella creatinophila]OLS01542.1 hypothetical protein TICRE_25810 [Tissierella creatinophila DSM 6911]